MYLIHLNFTLRKGCTVNLEILAQKNFCNELYEIIYTSNFWNEEGISTCEFDFLTTAEEYQHQSKQVRSRLPHEANNQYGGGILERRCCVQGYHMYKDTWNATVGEVLIYEQELTSLQYHSKCTSISYCTYFAGLIVRCINISLFYLFVVQISMWDRTTFFAPV